MPTDSTPRSLAFLILKLPGSTAPTLAKATLRPTRALGAPHTTLTCCSPSLTTHRRSLSASGCWPHSSTSPTTTPLNSPATGSTASTSRPAIDRRATSSSRATCGLTKLRSHCSLNFMLFSPSHQLTELRQKAQIIVEEQAQIINTITQHCQPLDPHAKRKTAIFFGIYSGHFQHIRMNHAAAHNL